MSSYCDYCNTHPEDVFNKTYHDTQYGFPLVDDHLLFERLVLEINQAGLSWLTILKKAENFRRAFDGFKIEIVAGYEETDRLRLLNEEGIIRNRLKINAAILNARKILTLRAEFGSFKGWLDAHHPRPLEAWVSLFRQHFVFVGPEIVREFLVSSGYLPGAHEVSCPIYAQTLKHNPPWSWNS